MNLKVKGKAYWTLVSALEQLKEGNIEPAIRALEDVLEFECPFCEKSVLAEEYCDWCGQPLKDFIQDGYLEYEVSYRDEFFAFVKAESRAEALEKFEDAPLVIGELWQEFFEVRPADDC